MGECLYACVRACVRVCVCLLLSFALCCSDYKEFEENPELDHYDEADLDNTKYAPMSGMFACVSVRVHGWVGTRGGGVWCVVCHVHACSLTCTRCVCEDLL